MSPPSSARLTTALLASLTAFAPLSIDMYLSSMPAMARDLGSSPAHIQWTLAAFFVGFALGQLFYGPLADHFGRRPPLFVGMSLYILTSAGCALALSADVLIGLRFLQAVGACSGGVIARAMVRDLYPPEDCGRVYASMMLVSGLAPMLAPVAGGYLGELAGWRSIFVILTVLGILGTLAAWRMLPESRPRQPGASFRPLTSLIDYGRMLAHRHFVGNALAGAFSMAGLFVYISGSPFIFISLYQIPPEQFGWYFGANALALVIAAQIAGWLSRRVSGRNILRFAVLWQLLACFVLLAIALGGNAGGFWSLEGGLMLFVCMIGCHHAQRHS